MNFKRRQQSAWFRRGDQGGVKVLATNQCLAIKTTILQAWSHIESVCLDENTFLGIATICCCEIVKTIQYINYHSTSIQPCLATAWQYTSKYSRNITKLYTNYELLFEENISMPKLKLAASMGWSWVKLGFSL